MNDMRDNDMNRTNYISETNDDTYDEINDIRRCISPSGELDDRYIWRREKLYQGMNGKYVERFYISPERSYVFKPVTHQGNEDRESWVYEHILSAFPPIYPRLLERSTPGQGDGGWTVFEDIGALGHSYKLEHALLVAEQMAWWHSFPLTHWERVPEEGQKPDIQQIIADLYEREAAAAAALEESGLPRTIAADILNAATRAAESTGNTGEDHLRTGKEAYPAGPRLFAQYEKVMSHGDLHLGNYAVKLNGEKDGEQSRRLYILDWEHAHANLPFWDLYYLIDMSHPHFPKQVTSLQRERILQHYLQQSAHYGKVWSAEDFIADYSLFAAIFSLWMLMLIASDLKPKDGNGLWPRELLLAQRAEAVAGLTACWTGS